MSEDPYRMQRFRGIAFLGSYLPRNCGIATFTHDLSNAVSKQAGVDQEIIVAAMNPGLLRTDSGSKDAMHTASEGAAAFIQKVETIDKSGTYHAFDEDATL